MPFRTNKVQNKEGITETSESELSKISAKIYLLYYRAHHSRIPKLIDQEVSNNHKPAHLRYTFFIMKGFHKVPKNNPKTKNVQNKQTLSKDTNKRKITETTLLFI